MLGRSNLFEVKIYLKYRHAMHRTSGMHSGIYIYILASSTSKQWLLWNGYNIYIP
jgi:hypothetical protein